jgi:hypothetical protein
MIVVNSDDETPRNVLHCGTLARHDKKPQQKDEGEGRIQRVEGAEQTQAHCGDNAEGRANDDHRGGACRAVAFLALRSDAVVDAKDAVTRLAIDGRYQPIHRQPAKHAA